jgi:hypothetical protein
MYKYVMGWDNRGSLVGVPVHDMFGFLMLSSLLLLLFCKREESMYDC